MVGMIPATRGAATTTVGRRIRGNPATKDRAKVAGAKVQAKANRAALGAAVIGRPQVRLFWWSSWPATGNGMPFVVTTSTADSLQTSKFELYFLMSIFLMLILFAMIFGFLFSQFFQCRRRRTSDEIWTAGTLGRANSILIRIAFTFGPIRRKRSLLLASIAANVAHWSEGNCWSHCRTMLKIV